MTIRINIRRDTLDTAQSKGWKLKTKGNPESSKRKKYDSSWTRKTPKKKKKKERKIDD